jgi:hypothetical protein
MTNETQTEKVQLISYGTCNVYKIDNKAYYKDIVSKKFIRAVERDNLIKKQNGVFITPQEDLSLIAWDILKGLKE